MDHWFEDDLVGAEEHAAFRYASEGEADYEFAREVGRANPDRAWIASPRDVWYANPFYSGPAVRHPEDDYDDDDGAPPAPRAARRSEDDDLPF